MVFFKGGTRVVRRGLVGLTLFVPMLLWSTAAAAQGVSSSAADADGTGGLLMAISYLVLWVFFGAMLLFVLIRQKRLQRELDRMEDRIDQALGTAVDDR